MLLPAELLVWRSRSVSTPSSLQKTKPRMTDSLVALASFPSTHPRICNLQLLHRINQLPRRHIDLRKSRQDLPRRPSSHQEPHPSAPRQQHPQHVAVKLDQEPVEHSLADGILEVESFGSAAEGVHVAAKAQGLLQLPAAAADQGAGGS